MQLDDFENLRHSPLLTLLSADGTPLTPVALQQLLLDEIEALAGRGDVPPRFWDVLYFRFVNQLNQDKVAYQFGISVRQLRRLQNNAIEYLAERLWQRFQLENGLPDPPVANPAIQQEVAWLREETGTDACRVSEELSHALNDVMPLAQRYDVTIHHESSQTEALAAIPPPVVRQALLTVISCAITQGGRHIRIRLESRDDSVRCTVELADAQVPALTLTGCQPTLTTVGQLLIPFGGKVKTQDTPPAIVVRLPTVQSVPILVLDDNPDARLLIKRYVTHSRYRIIATDNGRQAIQLAHQHQVRALLLDIMMADMAGWDLLSEWCHHPATRDIPVIVCTILPQEELAYLLGARAFLQKPVNRTKLLETLDVLTGGPTKTPG
ncbi:response regulator [Litorilinea aerophila]|nr:response regulator [Litorilinea aerophila]OUC07193.1 hypothetical protein RY27_16325 [Litorilinea aerophila]GIV78091.1 MAG: hypothetical protein KatS3mg050_2485 [Litorilinea sp.]